MNDNTAAIPFLVLALALGACGGGEGEPKTANEALDEGASADTAKADSPDGASTGEAAAPKAAAEPKGMPETCSDRSTDEVCLPPGYFATALCDADYPTVALAMFANGSPWTRGYSLTTSRAWNASGGGSSNEKMLRFEELLVLRQRVPKAGGIQVSGSGTSYDVLRWDGSCVTLQQGELTFKTPPKKRNARVVYKRLERHVRDALKLIPELRPTYLKHRKECKGVSMGAVSAKCEKIAYVFSDTIAAYVRKSGGVPTPKKLPKKR